MDQFRAKARQVAAAEKTAAGIESLHAKMDRVLALLGEAPAPEPPADEPGPQSAEVAAEEAPAEAAEEPEPSHRKRRK